MSRIADYLSRLVSAPKLLKLEQPSYGAPYELDSQHPLAKGLEGWWLFNEGAGTKSLNLAKGTFHEHTGIDGSHWRSGPLRGKSLHIEPGGYYINFGDDQDFNFEYNDPFTFCAWLKQGASPDYIAAKMFSNTPFRGWFVRDQSKKIRYYLRHTSSPAAYLGVTTVSNYLSSTEWRHICVTTDGSGTVAGTAIYVDGISRALSVQSDNLGANTTLTNAPFNLFARNNSNNWDGQAADVRIYRRMLTESEGHRIYCGEMPLKPRMPGWWPKTEITGFLPPVGTLNLQAGRLGQWESGDPERVLAETNGRIAETTTLTNPVLTLVSGRRVEN